MVYIAVVHLFLFCTIYIYITYLLFFSRVLWIFINTAIHNYKCQVVITQDDFLQVRKEKMENIRVKKKHQNSYEILTNKQSL